MVTIKIPYISSNENLIIINEFIHQYNSCLHFMYNRSTENKSEKEQRILSKSLNHIEKLDSWFTQSAIKEGISLHKKQNNTPLKKIIFGGKILFKQRCLNKISNEQFKLLKTSPLYSIGESSNRCVKGNRKFHLELDLNSITFKPNNKTKIQLTLPKLKRNLKETLSKLFSLQEHNQIALTYKLSNKFIYITYNESLLSIDNKIIKNRFLSIDLNPNYLGISVIDWLNETEYKLIDTYVFNIKSINDKEFTFKQLKLNTSSKERIHLNNKRSFETLEISKELVKICLHYKVETICLEQLNFDNKKLSKNSKSYNKLVNNNWLRTKLINNLAKSANLYQIKLQFVVASYSSLIGNTLFRQLNLPDMVLASIELSRRANLFKMIYIDKIIKKQEIIFPDKNLFERTITYLKSLEEFKIDFSKIFDWKDLYQVLKNSKMMYRVSLFLNKVFQMNSYKSLVFVHKYNIDMYRSYRFI